MRLRILSAVIVILIAALAYVAWNKNTQKAAPDAGMGGSAGATAPTGSGEETTPPAAGGMPPGMATTSPAQDPGVAWEKPKRWVEELASGMRLATYVVPSQSGGETGSCAVYYFGPGQGGGTDANIERWIGEFENPGSPSRREQKVRGMNVTQIEVSGTYRAHAGMSGGGSEAPSPGWTLLGAIVEGPNGALFFKLTGPTGTVEPAKKEFEALLASMKKK
jgi:hypothetical protein